jgi:hypothetical protein
LSAPAVWLSDLFAASGGEPVDYRGHTAHTAYRRSLSRPTEVELVVRSEQVPDGVDLRQGVRLAMRSGMLEVFGASDRAAELWSDYAPLRVRITCSPADEEDEFAVWNVWEYGGVPAQWIGQAGMLIEESADETVLRCSNGLDEPRFDDLVIGLRFLAPGGSAS